MTQTQTETTYEKIPGGVREITTLKKDIQNEEIERQIADLEATIESEEASILTYIAERRTFIEGIQAQIEEKQNLLK